MYKKVIALFIIAFCFSLSGYAQRDSLYTQTEVIYGRKDGMALTMFVTTPKKLNKNKAIIYVVSGGYSSRMQWVPDMTNTSAEFLRRGYTVFLVLHGSSPMYTVPDAVADLQRSVQFIRYHAKDYHIDPDHIGITGASSGGNLSLMMSVTDVKKERTNDPVAKVSSRVQAVACYYPPTDYINFGKPNNPIMQDTAIMHIVKDGGMLGAINFRHYIDSTKSYSNIMGYDDQLVVLKKVSPIYFVDDKTAPALIYHGDKDPLVPIQQSISYVAKLKSINIPTKLIVRPGGGHGWRDVKKELVVFADWFDEYLR